MTIPTKNWPQFLESTPPDTRVLVVNAVEKRWAPGSGMVGSGHAYFVIPATDIQLHCDDKRCGTDRTFSYECKSGDIVLRGSDVFVSYRCRNCRESLRVFALAIEHQGESSDFFATKYGEQPPFGPPVPARVISLIGPDRDLFLKARRAELRGLGIGAFAYYRRVVEDQTQRLFREMVKAAQHLHDVDAVALLERASNETQFTRAVDLVKDALPQRMWIHGQNPLTLLHNAMSNDLHAGSDEDCLAIATSIRVVLTELALRLDEIAKEDEGLRKAVSTLTARPKK